MRVFVEQQITDAIRKLLIGRVNEILRDEEFDTPIIEFGDYQGNDTVVPAVTISRSEKTEKERIVKINIYSLIINFNLPHKYEIESHCYAIVAAVCMALEENPTLGGVAHRAVVVGERYVPPKKADCGEGWEVTISLRVFVEELAHAG